MSAWPTDSLPNRRERQATKPCGLISYSSCYYRAGISAMSAIAVLLPCYCHVIGIALLCYVCLVIAMPLPCSYYCHVIVMLVKLAV